MKKLEHFPRDGAVRVKQAAPFLGIAVSTFWVYVRIGKIKKPTKLSQRVSVWDAEYIRKIAKNGIPEKREAA